MTINTVQGKDKTFTDPSKFIYSAVELDSDTWFFWLKEPDVKSFHYESEAGKFTARKEQRSTSTNEYWYAYRKIGGKLRKVYLGAMDELTGNRLEQVAKEISQPSWEFYSSRRSYTTKKNKSCVTEVAEKQSYTTDNKPSCVTFNSEVEELRAELENLRSQLAAMEQEKIGKFADEAKSTSVVLRGAVNYLENLVATGRLTQRLRDGIEPELIRPFEAAIKKLKLYYDY